MTDSSHWPGEVPPSDLELYSNYDLRHNNTLRLSSRAAWFAKIATAEHLQWAFSQTEMPVELVLGGGSNLVLGRDFAGLVVQLVASNISYQRASNDEIQLHALAGVNWHDLVTFSVQRNWWGLENLALIPGSVGAAPIQNIGAYGVELARALTYVEVFDTVTRRFQTLQAEDCLFGYRTSIFKQELGANWIVWRVGFTLHTQPRPVLSYSGLTDLDPAQVTPQQVYDRVCSIRRSKLPDPSTLPNVGSFFKNPIVSSDHFARLLSQYPDIVSYPAPEEQVKLAAGWLIDRCQWKGVQRDGVGVHDKQALVLVNREADTAAPLLQLAQDIQASVLARFSVNLEIEPSVVV